MENTKKYIPIIGLEIHLQVKTKSKMFCRCSAEYFNEAPNTHVCPVCFGLPGALPIPNKLAFQKAIKLARALNCEINTKTNFDRKNYFYPDIPKGYQISQFDKPIGKDGFVEIEVNDDSRRIRIHRLHLEEDTAKSMHDENGETLIDFNKSGVALIEMVTEPDFQNKEEVISFAKRLRQIVRYTDTSDAEMQKGQMRFELNISVKKPEENGLPNYKVEVKNIGSISVLEKVIDFELERQSELLEKGEKIKPQTRGLRDLSGKTVFQRSKETSDDYRYFPEPDIPPITITKEEIAAAEDSIGELPAARKRKYLDQNLDHQQAEILVENPDNANLHDEAVSLGIDPKFSATIINTDLIGLYRKLNLDIAKPTVTASDLKDIYDLEKSNKITHTNVMKALEIQAKEKVHNNYSAKPTTLETIEKEGLLQIKDDGAVEEFIDQVISENKKVVDDIQKNPNAIKYLVGQVMKVSKGRVNPNAAQKLLEEKLGIK